MSNLYSMTKNADAIRLLFGVDIARDRIGNLPSLPDHRAERSRRADPPKGHAGDPHQPGRI